MVNEHIIALQKRLDDFRKGRGGEFFRAPLVCYALAGNVLPAEEYQALEDVDLSSANFLNAHKGYELALAVLWIRRYYERSSGQDYWQQLLPEGDEGKVVPWNWKKFIRAGRWRIVGYMLKDSLLPKGDDNDYGAWIRSQCWVLKLKRAGHQSLTIKNNKAVFEVLKEEYPECKDWDFATLQENCEGKLQGTDYLEWLWKDKGRRGIYLQSLRAIAGYGEEPPAGEWRHTIWNIAPDHIRAAWKLYINGQACSLRLYVSLPETADRATVKVGGVGFPGRRRWISIDDLEKAGVDTSHKFQVEADKCKSESVKPMPEPAVFSMKKLSGGMAVLTLFDEKTPLPRRWQLAILHPRGGEDGIPAPCPEVYLCSQDSGREKLETKTFLRNEAYAVSLVSHTQKGRNELIGKTLQIGDRKFHLIFTPGLALGDTHEQELRTESEGVSTYYIRTDKVEILNDDLTFATLPEGLEEAALPEGRFLRLCPAAPRYGKGFTVTYSEKDAPNGRKCRFFFLEGDWRGKAQYIDMQGAPLRLEDACLHGCKVAEILPVYTGRKPKIRCKYGEDVFRAPLPAAIPYWHHDNHGPVEDTFGVRHEVADLYGIDREWKLRIVFPSGEDGGDAVIHIEKEGEEERICISAVDFIDQPERELNKNVEGGCLFRLYCESGGKGFLFFEGRQVDNPVWEEEGAAPEEIDPVGGLTGSETELLTPYQVMPAADGSLPAEAEIRFTCCKNPTPEMLGYGDLPPVEEETDAEPLADWAQREGVELFTYLVCFPDATAGIKRATYEKNWGFRLDFRLKNGIARPHDLAVLLRTFLRNRPDGFVWVESAGRRALLHWDGAHLETPDIKQLQRRPGCYILYKALSGVYAQMKELRYFHERDIHLDTQAFREAGGRLRRGQNEEVSRIYRIDNQPWLADWCKPRDKEAETVFFLLLWYVLKNRLGAYKAGYVRIECKKVQSILRWSGRDFTENTPSFSRERWADVLDRCPVKHRHLLPLLFSRHIGNFPEIKGELDCYINSTNTKP